nr:MAG TPA: Endomembrane protein 70 [Caudoviricetes sp.]
MKNLSSSNILLALVGLLISFFITIGSAKADAPAVNICAYSLIIVGVVSLMAEAFRLLIKENARWQWTRIVSWLTGGIVGTILGLLLS